MLKFSKQISQKRIAIYAKNALKFCRWKYIHFFPLISNRRANSRFRNIANAYLANECSKHTSESLVLGSPWLLPFYTPLLRIFPCCPLGVCLVSTLGPHIFGQDSNIPYYYPTALRRVQKTPEPSTNITRYLYSRGPVKQVCLVLLLLTNQLISWISRANSVPLRILLSRIPVNKYPRNYITICRFG